MRTVVPADATHTRGRIVVRSAWHSVAYSSTEMRTACTVEEHIISKPNRVVRAESIAKLYSSASM